MASMATAQLDRLLLPGRYRDWRFGGTDQLAADRLAHKTGDGRGNRLMPPPNVTTTRTVLLGNVRHRLNAHDVRLPERINSTES